MIAIGSLSAAVWIRATHFQGRTGTLAEADYYAHRGNWDLAGPIFAKLERRYHELGDNRNELYSHVSRFGLDAQSGNLQEASRELGTILRRAEVQKDLALKQRCLEMKAWVDLNFDGISARPSLEELERVAALRGDRNTESRASGDLGILAFLEGNPSEAKRRVAGAVAKAFAYRDVAAQIRYLSLIGQGEAETDRAPEALWLFNRAIGIAQRNPDTGFPKLPWSGKASALIQLGRFAEAKQVIDQGLQYARAGRNSGFEIEMLAQSGHLAESQNHLSDAILSFQNAAIASQRMQFNRAIAETNAELAALYQRTGDLVEAERREQISIAAHRQIGEVYELPHHLAVEARLQDALGQRDAAETTYSVAERIVGSMLGKSGTAGLKKSVLAVMSEVYVGHFRLEAQNQEFEKAYNVVEDIRGRVAADRLRATRVDYRALPEITASERRLALLQMQLLDTSDPRKRQRISDSLNEVEQETSVDEEWKYEATLRARPTLADVQRILNPDELLLEYVLGDPESFCLVIGRNRRQIVRLGSRRTIEEIVDRELAAIKSRQPATTVGRELFSAVLAPIPAIPNGASLILIPDGSLDRVPFSALVADDRRYLVQSHPISYSPSSSVLALTRTLEPSAPTEIVAVGNVPYAGSRSQTSGWGLFRGIESLERNLMSPLPATADEIRTVIGTLKDMKGVILSGAGATETNFKREAENHPDVIHLAVHAFTDEMNPDRAGLVFSSGDRDDDGLLQVREIRRLPLATTSLVTLSACDTGAGRIEGEEGVSSIVDAFLDAGARSAVATYWMVEDSTTNDLIRTFYRALSHGQTTAGALRSAQIEMITQGGGAKVPFYWAAFNVTGDGSRVIQGNQIHDN